MSTLANPTIHAQCFERLARIDPVKPPKWGKMNAHQMVCHLNDSFRAVMGEKFVSPASNLFTKTLMKWGALYSPVKWPRGVATRPEIEQGRGGTPPEDWARDCSELRDLMQRFPKLKDFGDHPFFGKLTYRDWMIWGYRHVDHHFRQFGV